MIVLLNGLSRSGKDTVAKYMSEHHGFIHSKISTYLKDAVSCMFGIPIHHFEDSRKDKMTTYGVTPRQMLKFIGTDVGQYKIEELLPGTNKCFWINRTIKDMSEDRNYVVSDYRFPHEYDAIRRSFPYKSVYVIRVVPLYSEFKQPVEIDESEQPLPCDHILYNLNKKELYHQISKFIKNK